jgi:predicted negative regulator of RcsB-dependent stress response
MQAESSGSLKTLELLAWLEANARKVALGAAVIAVVAGTVFFFKYQRGQRESAAAEALSLARAQAGRSGPNAADLRRVQASFAGTAAARQAGFLAAGALFAEGKFAEARAEFEKFTRDNAADPLAPPAALGVAACLESEKNLDGALAAYQSVIGKHPNDGVAIQAKLAIGRIQEAKGQHAEALKLYQETTRAGALSAWHVDFAARRDELLRRFPQLAVTNAPAPAPVNIPGTTPVPVLEKK